MITKKKLSYEGPVCEVFEVQSEAVMQVNSPYNRGGIQNIDGDNVTNDNSEWGRG